MKRRDYEILLLRKELEKRLILKQLENKALSVNKRPKLEKRLKKVEEEISGHRVVIEKINKKTIEKKE